MKTKSAVFYLGEPNQSDLEIFACAAESPGSFHNQLRSSVCPPPPPNCSVCPPAPTPDSNPKICTLALLRNLKVKNGDMAEIVDSMLSSP